MNNLKSRDRLTISIGKNVTVFDHYISEDYPLHWHSFFEIEIILSGSGKCIINDKKYDLDKYNVFLLTTTDFHSFEIDSPLKIINISFKEDLISENDLVSLIFSKTKKSYEFSEEEKARIVNAAELLRYECDTDGSCKKQLLHYIINCLLRKNAEHQQLNHDVHFSGVRKAVTFMELHFRENITLKRLSEEAGYNPTYFSEIFKRTTGESYITTLNKLRVGHARTLLANGFSVADACFLSGFKSLSNFGVIFKKLCGTSPKEYKKHHGNP